jgi:N-hydroxyarylamine O-acetyltransferase
MEATLDLDGYLARIGEPDRRQSSLDTLRRLHAAHVGAIPFENIDVQAGLGVRLDLGSLQHKLVTRRRGGYCFEQNTLFIQVLVSMGFRVSPCEARVRPPDAIATLPRTHMVLLVHLESGDWLTDVGFGAEGLLEPLSMSGSTAFQIDREFRVWTEDQLRVLQWRQKGPWIDAYAFEPHARPAVDFEVGNWWVSTHPSSIFRSRLTVQRTLPDARHVLRQLTYTVHRAGGSETREIPRPDLPGFLRDVFGLVLEDPVFPALDSLPA